MADNEQPSDGTLQGTIVEADEPTRVKGVRKSNGFYAKNSKGKSTRNLRTLELIAFATDILDRHSSIVDDFLGSNDERIKFDCWKFLWQYRYGLPTQRVELDLQASAEMLALQIGVPAGMLLAIAGELVDSTKRGEETSALVEPPPSEGPAS